MRNWLLLISMLFLLSCTDNNDDAKMLFSLNASSGTITKLDGPTNLLKLTLDVADEKSTDPVTVFSDRPIRLENSVRIADFLALWGKGATFDVDPPNASITFTVKSEVLQETIIATLTNPSLDTASRQLSFTISEVLDNSGLNSYLESSSFDSNLQLTNVSLFVDSFWGRIGSWFHHVGAVISGGFRTLTGDLKNVGDDIGSGVSKLGIEMKNGINDLSNYTKDDAQQLENEFKKAENEAGKDFKKLGPEIEDALLWVYSKAKCQIIAAGLDILRTTAGVLADLATEGEDSITWAEFYAAYQAASRGGQVKAAAAQIIEDLSEAAGANSTQATCISNSTSVILSMVTKDVDFDEVSFTLDLIQNVILAKLNCSSIFSHCI